jgi:hypothetical protein
VVSASNIRFVIGALLVGLIVSLSVGVVNSVHSDKFPQESGVSFLTKLFEVSLTNPFALVEGFLASVLFWRIKLVLYGKEEIKMDFILVVTALIMFVLGFLLETGAIVY